jgi:hypothetical protein
MTDASGYSTGDDQGRFAFITDPALRGSLQADYAELQQCLSIQAWKAVHVLAGSIIEALLVDSLRALVAPSEVEGLYKLPLDALITRCAEESLVSERAAQLSHVIRGYRNLIHPGRVIRLSERVDADGATVATALVNMVVEEVADARHRTYGLTAEQIVSKIESDPTAVVLVPLLLREMRETEIERLVVDVLPRRHLEAFLEEAESAVHAFEEAFRRALEMVSDEAKRQAAEDFVRVLREEAELIVRARERLFRARDMAALKKEDVALVKTHLLARLKTTEAIFETAKGLGPFLTPAEARTLAHGLARIAPALHPVSARAMHSFVTSLRYELKSEAEKDFVETIRSQARWAQESDARRPEEKRALRELEEALDDIPF